jgi:RimJ/RimL family protein N-acetyltransferase
MTDQALESLGSKPNRVLVRPATRADFDILIDEPLPYRVRATAAERGGKLVAVGGLAFQPDDTVAAFLILAPGERGAKGFKLALHKAGLRMMADARRLGIRRVVATAEHNNPQAEPWLARLGFERAAEGANAAWIWRSDR